MQDKKTEGATSIRKCLSIINLFTWETPRLSLTQISTYLNVTLPTASRIVAVLCEEGFLEKGENKLYQLGWKCCRMGAIFQTCDPVKASSKPIMTMIRDAFNETVSLYQVKMPWRVCVDQVQSTHALKRTSYLGEAFPMWAGAAGRCFMAYMSPIEIEEIKNNIPEQNMNIWPFLINRIDIVRKQGYEASISEREAGISSIAAPIFDFTNKPTAVMTVSGPSFRFTDNMTSKIIIELLQQCKILSLSFGASPNSASFSVPTEFPRLCVQ